MKHGKKTAIFLVVCMLMSVLTALPSAADGALLVNGSFETAGTSDAVAAGWNSDAVRTASSPEQPAKDGDWYATIAAGASTYVTKCDILPETEYMLTIWAKTTTTSTGYIDLRFYNGGNTLDKLKTLGGYNWPEHLYQEYFGTDGMTGDWVRHQFVFTSSARADGVILNLYNKSAAAMLVDAISLEATGNAPNLIKNGYFEATKNGGVLSEFTTDENVRYTLETNEEGENVVKATSAGYLKGMIPLPEGKYKLSFDYKTKSGSYAPFVYMGFDGGGTYNSDVIKNGYRIFSFLPNGTWTKVSMSFTVPFNAKEAPGILGYYLNDFRFNFGYCNSDPGNEAYLKNLRLWYDDSEIEYSSYPWTRQGYFMDDFDYTPAWITKAGKITDCVKVGSDYKVIPKAHYVPETNEDEDVIFMTGLYRVYPDGKLFLEKLMQTSGTATGGRPIDLFYTDAKDEDVTKTVTGTSIVSRDHEGHIPVPTLSGDEGYTYEVRSFVWNSLADMQPKAAASVLTY